MAGVAVINFASAGSIDRGTPSTCKVISKTLGMSFTSARTASYAHKALSLDLKPI